MIDEHTNVVDTFNISNDLLGQGVAGCLASPDPD